MPEPSDYETATQSLDRIINSKTLKYDERHRQISKLHETLDLWLAKHTNPDEE